MLEHRLETVGEWEGVHYVNDSKSTTPSSLLWALHRYPDSRVLLIAGGRAKSQDFDTVFDLLKIKAKHVFLIGEATGVLGQAWEGASPITRCQSLEEACSLAIEKACEGDTVLFSPACSSFDMFKNYGERGEQFKEIIQKTVNPNSTKSRTGVVS